MPSSLTRVVKMRSRLLRIWPRRLAKKRKRFVLQSLCGLSLLCLLTLLDSNLLRKRKPTELPTRPPTKHGLNRTPLCRSRRQTKPAADLRELRTLLFLFLMTTDWSSAPERLTFCTSTNEPAQETSNTWLSRMSLPRWQRNGRA